MKKIAPNWVLWISIIALIVGSVAGLINMIISLKNLYDEPASSLGQLFATIGLIYFIGYIPISVLYSYIKEHKK